MASHTNGPWKLTIDSARLEQLISNYDLDSQVEWYIFGRCPHPREADSMFIDGNQPLSKLHQRWECGICATLLDTTGTRPIPPPYSTSIAVAWPLVALYHLTVHPELNAWEVVDCNWGQSGEINAVGTTNGRPWVRAPTAPGAICIAALAIAKRRRRHGASPIPSL